MKALIANNQSCAVIYDCEDEHEDSQVLLDSGITAVDESQMFKIVFSPEKVICEVPFYEKTEKETKSIIAAIKKFGETFLHDVIEIAKKKNDFFYLYNKNGDKDADRASSLGLSRLKGEKAVPSAIRLCLISYHRIYLY